MATKSRKLQRLHEPYPVEQAPQAKPRARRDTKVDTALPGVSATDRKAGLVGGGVWSTAERNLHRAGKQNATDALEDSATGRPSRKSTRGSSNHIKRDSNLKRRQTRSARSPATRAAKASARNVSPRGH
jgi:hypothetical protein